MLAAIALLSSPLALNVGGVQPLSRRAVFSGAASAAVLLPALPALAAESKEAASLRETSKAMKAILDTKADFVSALVSADFDALPKLPAQIPLRTFQALEKTSEPEFMEAAIDYAEAYRGVKDLYKLAKLTRETVTVSTKEKGKPRESKEMAYGDAPNNGLASTKEYADRAVQELLGASLALDAAIGYMK